MVMIALLADLFLSGTIVTLRPTEYPGAVAEVVMQNVELNGPHDNGAYPLEMDGIAIVATFVWDDGADGEDTVAVTPPDGLICIPQDCRLTVPEGATGALYLIEWVGF